MHESRHSKFTYRKYLIATLFLFVGLILCSCSSSGNTNIPSENNFVSKSEEVVITFSADDSLRSIIEPLIETFHEENSSITVQFVPLSADSYSLGTTIEDRLLMLASSADTTLTAIRSAQAGSFFLDLQPLIDSDTSFDQTDFWHGTLAGMEDSEGRMMGLPMKLFLRGIFYDKSAFDAAYIPYPQPGWTWHDFRIATAALAKVEGGNIRYGYADRESASILEPLIGYNLALNDGEVNTETLTDELEWYVQMAQEEQILGMKSTDDFWISRFDSGEPPGMWYGSLFEFILGGVTGESEATDLKAFFTDSAYGFAPFPVDVDGEHMKTTPITALYGAISVGSEHPLESWKWLNYLSEHWLVPNTSSPNNQLHIPARQSVAESAGFWDNYPPEVQKAMQYGLEHAWFSSLYSKAETAVLNAVQKVTVVNSSLMIALEDVEVQQASWPQENLSVPDVIIVPPEPFESTALGVETINFYHNSYDRQGKAAIAALINQFNRDHKNEIIVHQSNIMQESGGYFAQMTDNYDCFLSQLWSEGAASSGLILDLTTLMEAEDAAFQQDFDTLLLDAAQYKDGLYALPLSNQPAIMVYNADLLAELGLEPPSLDWTFDEFLDLIIAISSSSGSEPIYGFLPGSHLVSTTEMFYAGRGVQWRDTPGDFPVVMFDTPEMADAITWLAELKLSGVLFQAASGSDWYPSIANALNSGQIGFWTADAGKQDLDISEIAPLTINVGIAPLPYIDKPNGSYASNYMTGFYISNKSENPQACWELAKYFSEGADGLSGVPARTSVANSADWEAYVGADNAEVYRAAITRNLSGAEVDLYNGWFWYPIISWRGQASKNIENGNNPAQELALAQQYADAYLACMASYDVLSLSYDALKETVLSCSALVDPD